MLLFFLEDLSMGWFQEYLKFTSGGKNTSGNHLFCSHHPFLAVLGQCRSPFPEEYDPHKNGVERLEDLFPFM